jgi:hypothetical protein
MRREDTNTVRVVINMNVEGKRGRGRTKKRWLDMIENDMNVISVYVGDVENQDEWSFRTRVADPK